MSYDSVVTLGIPSGTISFSDCHTQRGCLPCHPSMPCAVISDNIPQVLTHGYMVTHHNVSKFIEYISVELNKFENGVAEYMQTILHDVCHQPHLYRSQDFL